MSKDIIRIEKLVKRFTNGMETLTILDGLDLIVTEPRTIAVTGESGSGKSTLLNLLGGLDRASGGEIHIGGRRIDHLPESDLTDFRMHTVGFIFQFHFLLKDFTALENVMLPGFMSGMSRTTAFARAEYLLEQVHMENRLEHYPGQLSGGEKQRVAVARSLMNDPEIILADEPTGNLDENNSRNVEDILFALVKQFGKTLILVTHDMELSRNADASYHLSHGRVEVT